MADDKRSLKATLRTDDFGSAGSRRLVRAGSVPAVVYGKNAPIHVVLSAREFRNKKNAFTESTLIKLDVDGKVLEVFVKDVQEDFLKGIVNHVDFFEITRGQALRTNVRVEFIGTAKGTREGGIFDVDLHEVEVECLPKDLPETLKVDISALGLGDVIRVSDLIVPANVKVLEDAKQPLGSVLVTKDTAPAAKEEEEA